MAGRLDRLMVDRDSCLRIDGRRSLLVCRREEAVRANGEDDHDGRSDVVGSHLLGADDPLLYAVAGFALFPICLAAVLLLLEMLLLCPCSSSSPSFLCPADHLDCPILALLRHAEAHGPSLMLLRGYPWQRQVCGRLRMTILMVAAHEVDPIDCLVRRRRRRRWRCSLLRCWDGPWLM